MKNFKNESRRELIDCLYELPLFILGLIVLLFLVFDFSKIIYGLLILLVLIAVRPWINFVEKHFDKRTK